MYSSFKDNIWGADLADMQLISKYNKEIRYLLCAIDLLSKYAFVVPLKDKKGTTIVKAFQKILNISKRRPNKIWLNKGSEFYNAHFKKWLKDNNIEMYSTHNEGKSEGESNKKDPKFKLGDHVRISKYKNIIAKGYVCNLSEIFIEKKKNTVPWIYVISDLNGEKIVGSFYEKELQKTNHKEFRIEKIDKRKGNKLYVKWKSYISFNSWIDKKDLIK